jgi:hypothetical protein
MAWFGKAVAITIVILLSILAFGNWIFIPIAIILLIIVVRLLADLFWFGRDRGHW